MSKNNYDGRIITEKDQVIRICRETDGYTSFKNVEGNYRVVDDFRPFYEQIILEHSIAENTITQIINHDGSQIEEDLLLEKCYFGTFFVSKKKDEDVAIYDWQRNCYLEFGEYIFNDVTDVVFKQNYMLLYGTINHVKNRVALINEEKITSIFSDKASVVFGPNEQLLIQNKLGIVVFDSHGELITRIKGLGLRCSLEEYGIKIVNSHKNIMYMLYDKSHVVDFKDNVREFTMMNPNLYAYRGKSGDYTIADAEGVIPERFIEDIKGLYLTPDRIFMLRQWSLQDLMNFQNDMFRSTYYPTYCHDFSIYESNMKRLGFDVGNGVKISWDCNGKQCLLDIDGKRIYFDKNGNKYNVPVVVLGNNAVYRTEAYYTLVSHPDISDEKIERYNNGDVNEDKKSSQFKRLVL